VWKDKSILITGAGGTIGRSLLENVLHRQVHQVIAFDHSETEIYKLSQHYAHDKRVRAIVGNVRSRDSLLSAMHGVDIVFHGAALKHVNLGELTPDEIVGTNIIGVQNVIHSARIADVERVVFMSSDKAVNPTNVMGTSKLMGERLISAANHNGRSRPVFSSTRFGNVLGSSGSAVPTFLQQIRAGQAVTLTDPQMSRFVMTPNEAVALLMKAAELAQGGEVYVTKMPVMMIRDMLSAIIDLYAPSVGRNPKDVAVTVVGRRPGEKLYEELLSSEESNRVTEMEQFFVVHPAVRGAGTRAPSFTSGLREYRSDAQSPMTLDEIKRYIVDNRLLEIDFS
jgi:FlaA1/EpsC-like NDP-sugar epimerase